MEQLPIDWLICKKTPEEFEREHLETKAELFSIPIEKIIAKYQDNPFGKMTTQWRNFLKQMQDGDELWKFKSSDRMIMNKIGIIGFVIIRDGQMIESLTLIRA